MCSTVLMAAEIDFSGTTKNHWTTNIDGGSNESFVLSLLPELNVNFDNDWQLTSTARIRADLFDETYPAAVRRDGVSSMSKSALLSDHLEVELREFYLEGEVGETFVTLGKQQVVWGKSDGLKVLDIVNPQSFNEFILV